MADTARFIVIYPQGLTNSWGQTGWNNGTLLSPNADDLTFFDAMINDAINTDNANPARIYVSGFSMGAIMSYHLACNRNDRIAAIGVMSGAMSSTDYSSCSPTYITPVIHIHGDADGTVPYQGSPIVSLKLGKDSFDFWATAHACATTADSTRFPDSANDGLTFDRFVMQNCSSPGAAELIRANGGGHNYWYKPANDITEIQEIWRFFRQWEHNNPATASVYEVAQSLINIQPNPGSDIVNVILPTAGEVMLIDQTGRVVKTILMQAGKNELNITHLTRGVYFLKFGSHTEQLIKQ